MLKARDVDIVLRVLAYRTTGDLTTHTPETCSEAARLSGGVMDFNVAAGLTAYAADGSESIFDDPGPKKVRKGDSSP